jgi:5-carboxymethyl-2-hydroxymuconate isomerase
MPHLNIEYPARLESLTGVGALCEHLRATLVALRGENEVSPLFPMAGTRVFGWPAPHAAVADGEPDRLFVYLNLRITPGRSERLKQRAGDALLAAASAFLEPVFASQAIGLTLQIDEGVPVYEGKRNNLTSHLKGQP